MDNSAVPNFPNPEPDSGIPDGGFVGPVPSIPTNTVATPSSSSPKPKRKLGPIIATAFGLLLLLVGVGAGLVLVGQQQHGSQKAAPAPNDCTCDSTDTTNSDCHPLNLFCNKSTNGSCNQTGTHDGLCQATCPPHSRPNNGICESIPQCGTGLICDITNNGGSLCWDANNPNGWYCKSPTCTKDSDCQSGNYCDRTNGECEPVHVTGALCSGTSCTCPTSCGNGCTGNDQYCPGGANGSCTQNDIPFSVTPGTTYPSQHAGETCGLLQVDIECRGGNTSVTTTAYLNSTGNCNTGTGPTPTPPPGGTGGCYAACTTAADCQSGFSCILNNTTNTNVCYASSCTSGGGTSTSANGTAYCQDGNGTKYPLPGIQLHLTGHDEYDSGTTAYPTQTTDANGNVTFTGLSTFPNQWFEGLVFPNGWGAGIHPFANFPQYANMTVPGTNQLYSQLTVGDTHNSILENCATTSSAWLCPHYYQGTQCGGWYCDNWTPASVTQNWQAPTPPSYLSPYGYSFQDYNPSNYLMAYHFSNCGGTAPTPTPPGVAPMCGGVKAYDSNWNLLDQNALAALQPGTSIYFTVVGSGGTFDMARFTINGTLMPNTTTTKPGSPAEFSQIYTIPAGTTSFTVTAEMHDTVSNAWY